MSEKSPAIEEYTPTRLEWLSVYLNSILPTTILQVNGIQSVFLINDEKGITLKVRHYSDMDDNMVKDYVESIEELIASISKLYEWDSWLEVNVVYDEVEREGHKNVRSDS